MKSSRPDTSVRADRFAVALNSNIDVVFFDAAGTLFEVHGSVGEIYSAVARSYGVEASPGPIEAAFIEEFRRKSSLGIRPGDGRNHVDCEKQWWFEVVREVFRDRMPRATLRRYFDELYELFRTNEAWRLFPDTVPSLVTLRDAGYRLGIISNFDSRLTDLLESLGIGSMFEHVTFSWQVGASKPDPAIYRSALAVMNVMAERAVHIGDSLREDFAGAQSVGIQGILLDRRNVLLDWKEGRRICSLSELCGA